MKFICSIACALLVAGVCLAADARPENAPPAVSRIVLVTLYQSNALVTREVDAPAQAGVVELVVGPLPPSTEARSLFAEGNDAARVLTTRYRTRVAKENIQEEVRKLEEKLKELRRTGEMMQRQAAAMELNLALLAKMESFTAGALQQMSEKGRLEVEGITKLAGYITETRMARTAEITDLQQKIQANNEAMQFTQREMSKVAGGSDKTIREAVIVVDKADNKAAKVRLNYLVSSAGWKPQYKLRASRTKSEVQLEYLAGVAQQSGEDWSDVELVLSTAQPLLNAAPPELTVLTVTPGGGRTGKAMAAYLQDVKGLKQETHQLRQQAQQMINNDDINARAKFNEAATMEQSWEILNPDAEGQRKIATIAGSPREGQSVTFRLERRLSVPWREDEQLIELARVQLKPDYFYKAVPILTPHVYRQATLTNDSKFVLLPGETNVYNEADFVGRTRMPLVAIGAQFTVGLGVDPQIQVQRDLMEKTKSIQGGNHVLKFNYRIAISNYKNEPATVQLWDRVPHSETESVSVTLITNSPELSKDPTYVREEKPKNLLRWDLTVPANAKGEKAFVVVYEFKLELDRNMRITPPPAAEGMPAPAKAREMYDLQLK